MDLFEDFSQNEIPFSLPVEDGYSVCWDEGLRGFHITLPHGAIFYATDFFDKKISDRSVEYFLENDTFDARKVDWRKISAEDLVKIKFKNILWKQDFINLFGIKPLPRLTSWYGDEGKSYSYSGIKSMPNAWNKGLIFIKEKIEAIADVEFNSVLLNWYRDGEDYLNWHADNEKELGSNPVIGSVNFGETRDFCLRLNSDTSKKITIPLSHGTVLIMRGEIQHFWEHCVPKRKNIKNLRINLTFRKIMNS